MFTLYSAVVRLIQKKNQSAPSVNEQSHWPCPSFQAATDTITLKTSLFHTRPAFKALEFLQAAAKGGEQYLYPSLIYGC